jgi:site-specific recombinase XerD
MNIPKYIDLFRNEITRKGFRPATIKNYVSCIECFLHYFEGKVTEPVKINEQQIKDYLATFKQHNTQRANHSAIKSFFLYTLKQPNKFKYIEYCKRDRKLPIVLSIEEIQKLFNACTNIKHKAILALLYSAGLRVSEVINLKITNIDSTRMIINIINAKGGKDRQVMLNQNVLELLRNYYKMYRPKEYLFNGQNSQQYSSRSINEFLKTYAEKAGIENKRIYAHLMRHTSFTHMVENGTDINLIQKLSGHSSVKTTLLYTHISHNLIKNIQSPISNISL